MVCSRYPKECRYYETVLKRKCLTKLKNNVWESKTKWKLVDKAVAHWRCKLLRKHLSLWMGYVVERYKKEINARSADAFYEERLKGKGIQALKKNAERNWILSRFCRKKLEWNVKFRLWHQWKHYTEKRLKVKEIKLLANRIREERLRIRYIYLWSFRLNERRSQVDAYRKITVKYETKLKEKCLNSWKLFTRRKKFKKKIDNLAVKCHEDKVLERCFLSWKSHFFRKTRYRNHVEIIRKCYETHLIKNHLTEWWTICKKVKLERKFANYRSAHNFHRKRLLERSFRILWKVREARREMREKIQTFCYLYESIHINFYVNKWMTRRSEKILWNIYEAKALKWRENWLTDWALSKLTEKYKERTEEKEEMSKVVKYSNSIRMHRAFRAWTEVTIRSLNKKIKTETAREFQEERLTRKSFKKWKGFVCRKFRKKIADDHYRNTLLFKCANRWRVFVDGRRMKIKEAKNLERLNKTKLMKQTFDCWKKDLEVTKTKNATAVHFYTRKKLRKCFHTWREFTRIKITKKNRYDLNKTVLCGIIIKSVISRWNEVYCQRQCRNQRLEKFRIKREKRLVRLCFVNWARFVEKMKKIHEVTLRYPKMKNCLLLEECLALLLRNLKLKKIANRKEELARRTEEKLLKRKYLKKLVSFVCWKKEKLLRCMSEERKKEARADTTGKSTRRKPIIPDYLRGHIPTDDIEDRLSVNEETFRVVKPTNKKLPVFGHDGVFAFFDT